MERFYKENYYILKNPNFMCNIEYIVKDKSGKIIQEPLGGVIKRIDRVSNALSAQPPVKPLSTKPADLPVDDKDISK